MSRGIIYVMTTVVPELIKIGKTVPENCQMLCDACNLKKSALDANFV